MDYRDGFTGCMRGLQVNGEIYDLIGQVARNVTTYGLSEGTPHFRRYFFFLDGNFLEHSKLRTIRSQVDRLKKFELRDNSSHTK